MAKGADAMTTFDLTAYRAAKTEAEGEGTPKQVVVGEETHELPASVPLVVLELLAEGEVRASLTALGGEDFASAMLSAGMDANELQALFAELYGESAGN